MASWNRKGTPDPETILTEPAGPAREKFRYFVDSTIYHESVLIGGMGASKTTALIHDIILTAHAYPGCELALFRARFTDLLDTSVAKLVELAEDTGLGKLTKGNNLRFTFNEINGKKSVVYCIALDTPDWLKRLKSINLFRAYFDEVNEIPSKNYRVCLVRARAKVRHIDTGEFGDVYVKSAMNDEGNDDYWARFVPHPHPVMDELDLDWVNTKIGETFVRTDMSKLEVRPDLITDRSRLFHLDKDHTTTRVVGHRRPTEGKHKGRLFVRLEDGRNIPFEFADLGLKRCATYIMTDENWSLNDQNLLAYTLAGEDIEAQYRYGQIDIKAGKMFPTFNKAIHVVDPYSIPDDWPVIIGYDHGTSHPAAAVYIAVDFYGNHIIFDEYYDRDRTIAEHSISLRQLLPSNRHRSFFYGPPDLRKRTATDRRTLSAHYAMHGVRFRMADDRRDYGVETLKSLLAIQGSEFPDTAPQPKLFVMRNCVRIIDMFQNFTWELFHAKKQDHVFDATRYGLVSAKRERFTKFTKYNQPPPDEAAAVPKFGSLSM